MNKKNVSLFIVLLIVLVVVLANKKHQLDKSSSDDYRIKNIMDRMSLQDKIGQMILVDKNAITLDDVRRKSIGGILSGGGGNPTVNTREEWFKMVNEFQTASMESKLRIPILYGVDAVHGHGNLKGAVIFPHNIGLGATRNANLVYQIAVATAEELEMTGVNWNFAPVLSMPEDIRWGRVYECFSSNKDVVSELGSSYIRGLHSKRILSTPKHFIGEGAESWNTSKEYKLDQGDIGLTEDQIKELYLLPFKKAVDDGAMSIMVSRSSISGKKISGNSYLLTELLKNEMGFKGFLVSDWGAIDQLSDDYYKNIITSINAGMDMLMLPGNYDIFMNNITSAVNNGEIPMSRIDDAVRRILTAKESIGLFDVPIRKAMINYDYQSHRAIARQAVRESLVLLKNDNQVLPLKSPKSILVVGRAADDIGMQSGGWTIDWQGGHGDITPGTAIIEAIESEFTKSTIVYDPMAEKTLIERADIGIVVVGEKPYAEGVGDRETLYLSPEDLKRIVSAKKNSKQVVVIILAGRPLIIEDILDDVDAVVMAWWPGTEAAGITDVLSGKFDFTGKLPLAWPKTMGQIENKNVANPLYEYGFGLSYN